MGWAGLGPGWTPAVRNLSRAGPAGCEPLFVSVAAQPENEPRRHGLWPPQPVTTDFAAVQGGVPGRTGTGGFPLA